MPIIAFQLHFFFPLAALNMTDWEWCSTAGQCVSRWKDWFTLYEVMDHLMGMSMWCALLEDPLLLFQWNFLSLPVNSSLHTLVSVPDYKYCWRHTHTLLCPLRRRHTPAITKSHARDTHVNYKALPKLQSAPKGNQPFNASSMRI